ncbi:hypothetical protein EV193_102768 [Herbihabitans rhizosphaerae]|uniref:Helix-turn-helix protein n=1 Tax=Herbihabitans rhizosphaerae TaxID=1872711 RepID=A0A4Q7L3H3_9PSEU|nr:helix-turn-helix transcriptional regulator [Herbihabitans rhizosphaerae]RZS43787.1 hypothetical protein EV193_102768 [Herbihabitans rhizosphaerae]
MTEDVVARNRKRQVEWYGEPLGELIRRVLDRLSMSQAGLAEILGLSAPMLSQLMSGNRAKISNPMVYSRLVAVRALVDDPSFDQLPAKDVKLRLDAIREEASPTVTTTRVPLPLPADAGQVDPVAVIQRLLRAAASAGEIEQAAAMLAAEYPDLAEFLRIYGNGRTAEARAHLSRTLA